MNNAEYKLLTESDSFRCGMLNATINRLEKQDHWFVPIFSPSEKMKVTHESH